MIAKSVSRGGNSAGGARKVGKRRWNNIYSPMRAAFLRSPETCSLCALRPPADTHFAFGAETEAAEAGRILPVYREGAKAAADAILGDVGAL